MRSLLSLACVLLVSEVSGFVHPSLPLSVSSSRNNPGALRAHNTGGEGQEAEGRRPWETVVQEAGQSVVVAAGCFALAVGVWGGAAVADGSTEKFNFPPIDATTSRDRCTFKSSAMGQANAARDKLYDLRQCKMSGKDATSFDMSGVIASEADFSNVNFREAVMSKAYARNSNFAGADFTNAVVDRVSFDNSNMKDAVFQNTVLTSTSFNNADVTNADFTDAYMGEFDLKNLCKNPTLKGENPLTGVPTKESLGCGAGR